MNDSAEKCHLCGRMRPAARCEDWDSVAQVLEEQQSYQLLMGKPDRVSLCKDCCIGPLKGHHCAWWGLCWR